MPLWEECLSFPKGPKDPIIRYSALGQYPKGPSNGIVYTLGAQIPTTMVLGPFGIVM